MVILTLIPNSYIIIKIIPFGYNTEVKMYKKLLIISTTIIIIFLIIFVNNSMFINKNIENTDINIAKEYKNELGIPINEETDDDKNALQKAGAWIKDKIDKFIALIKRWAGIIGNFLTKTVPGWISKVINGLLVLLHIRQKTEKVDSTKIKNKNKEIVKTACDQASKANRVIVAAKEEKKNKVVAAPKISGFKDNDGTLSKK